MEEESKKKRSKKKEKVEEVMPYHDELSIVVEDKKPSIVIYISVLVLILITLIVGIYSYLNDDVYEEKGFIKIGEYQEKIIYNEYYPVYSMSDLERFFPDQNFSKINLDQKDYVILELEDISCGDEQLKPTSYHIINNRLSVSIQYTASCDLCDSSYLYYLLELDKGTEYSTIHYNYQATNDLLCDISMN